MATSTIYRKSSKDHRSGGSRPLDGSLLSRAMRLLLALCLSLPLAAQQAQLTPFAEQKARALLRDHLPCLGCHELDGDGGRIAPSLTSVAQRRSAAYIEAMVADPQRVVPGAAMPRTLMPKATRDVVVALLTRGAAQGERLAERTVPGVPAMQAADLYVKWCAACHGARGGGDGPNAERLPVRPAVHSSSAAMSARSDDALFDAIAGGGSVMGKSARMPAFGATLSPAEIRSLVAYIRQLCACAGPSWSRDGKGS
jgi:mono/diheme cytochrome c family protein